MAAMEKILSGSCWPNPVQSSNMSSCWSNAIRIRGQVRRDWVVKLDEIPHVPLDKGVGLPVGRNNEIERSSISQP